MRMIWKKKEIEFLKEDFLLHLDVWNPKPKIIF